MSNVELSTTLGRYPTATLFEATERRGAMAQIVKPLSPGQRIAGVAYTVRCAPYDNLAVHRSLTQAPAGVVLVIDTMQGQAGTYCGDIIARAAQACGIVGIVLDAHVRDANELRELGFPLFCHGSAIGGARKEAPGSLQVPVVCGGVAVSPGDVIVGDDDGVIVIRQSEAEHVLTKARQRDEWEQFMIQGLAEGRTLLDLLQETGKVADEG